MALPDYLTIEAAKMLVLSLGGFSSSGEDEDRVLGISQTSKQE